MKKEYLPQVTAERIKSLASANGISISKLNEICELSKNTIAQTGKGTEGMKARNLFLIAETLDCSVDYLLGRTDKPKPETANIVKDNHNNIVQGINAVELAVPVTAAQETQLDENQQELLKRFGQLSYAEKIEFMQILINKTEKGND